MRRFIYLAMAVGAALGYSGSAAGMSGTSEPAEPARFQLVGFTVTTFGIFSDSSGPSLFDMIAACQSEVDPSSRMCRVDDIQLTTVIPLGLPTVDENGNLIRAWLNPDPGRVPNTQIGGDCFGWSISGALGMTVDARGQMISVACNVLRPVACCALVP